MYNHYRFIQAIRNDPFTIQTYDPIQSKETIKPLEKLNDEPKDELSENTQGQHFDSFESIENKSAQNSFPEDLLD